MSKIIFRFNENGKTPSTWSLKQESVMAVKEGKGKKFIAYYPGADTCFVEDIKNKDLKPSKVPLFKFNPSTKHTELSVDSTDTALIRYLKTHPWFGSKYIIWSKESDAANRINQFDKIEKALDLIRESNDIRVKAIALAVLGLNAFSKSASQCIADLKQKAFDKPDEVISAMEAPNYENKYLSGLSFASGIIKTNHTSTAVVWSNNDGIIFSLATGENGVDKMADYLTRSNDESIALMQELQLRIDEALQKDLDKEDQSALLSEKDKKIAELQKQLASHNTAASALDTGNGTDDGKQTDSQDLNNLTLEDASRMYSEKTKENIPLRYKNNLEWIISKLKD